MTEPDRKADEQDHPNAPLWAVVGVMVLISLGGLAYGLFYPSIYATNPPQTVGSAAAHARSGHPM
jgi:hypothetical protein